MSAKLTIFTPTYNRADCLKKNFNALKSQKCKDFVWLIIDDGSTDNTHNVVDEFMQENCGFEIRYKYKNNGGLHTAYNEAIAMAETELSMCIDSDDRIAEDAVEFIIETWEKVKKEGCGGIVGLDAGEDNIPSFTFNEAGKYINLNKYDSTHKWAGDRKLVVRTDLYKAVAPMPSFGDEKNFNPQYMHIQIAQDNVFYVVNKILCIVDYQKDGMSAGIYRQFVNSPNSFAEYRRMQMQMKPNNWKYIMKNAVHYDSSCIIAGKIKDIYTKSPYKFLTTCMFPAGLLLSCYIKIKARY